MIVPSIDLMDGRTVQLRRGRERVLDAGDPAPLAERFARCGEIAVVDLDAALGRGADGPNRARIAELCARHEVRVGGGIRDYATAARWLDAGAAKIVLGTAAAPELLRRLPRERVIAALDCEHGEVVVEGWRTRTGARVEERMDALRPYVGGFLVTFVEREGCLQGTDLARAEILARAAGDARLTIAGGVTRAEEVAVLDRAGADAQIGMALYTGVLDLAAAFAAPLVSDRADGLWPTLVCDPAGRALGLCWSNLTSLRAALESGRGTYWSRRRGLWRKGESSGATQELLRVEADCDRDALRFVVRQAGAGFCHRGTADCFRGARGLEALERTLHARRASAPQGSYAARILDDPALLEAKLREEAGELAAEAAAPAAPGAAARAAEEAADLVFFLTAALARAGARWEDVERVLDRRARRLTRRGGEAKPLDPAPR